VAFQPLLSHLLAIRRDHSLHLVRAMGRRSLLLLAVVVVVLIAGIAVQRWRASTDAGSAVAAASSDDASAVRPVAHAPDPDAGKPVSADERTVSDDERLDALARAAVWQPPRQPVAAAWLGGETAADFTCRFKLTELGGTTPKFDCVLDSGETIRIKYGKGPEIPAEAAATRLLAALGERLRCYGCPAEPFSTMRAVEMTKAEPLYKHVIDYDNYRDFEWVAVERKLDARQIESDTVEGWAFFELDKVDAARGGAPRAHVDALRLMAAFLAHWDNKPENQRLVCLSREWRAGTACPRPFLLIQDTGATFGPSKVDLKDWEAAAIWDDRRQCTVSLRHLPYEGATFGHATISEAGRRHLGGLLTQLTDRQIADLFTGARFDKKHGLFSGAHPVPDWVRVFKQKVAEISGGPACPTA
jgi:hypothetical protein